MKNLLHVILLVLCFQSILSAQDRKKRVWTESDRQFLVDGLRTSQTELIKELENVNEAQMVFKPNETKWSIKEIVEHIGVYEEYLNWDLVYGIYTPERPELVKKVKGKDATMIAYEKDPNKGLAPWLAKPLGRFNNKVDLIKYFNTFRDSVIHLILSTKADLRLHFIFREPASGEWQVKDLHQQALLYIAHNKRHTEQIRKVKADVHYPVNGKLWTEADRQYTVDNFQRTRDALVKETEGLTMSQWNFRESPDRWTIGEIVEHLGIWERAWSREIDIDTRNRPQPELNGISRPDSYYNEFIMEEKKHDAPDFAKPTGLLAGKNNITFFLTQHALNMKFVETTSLDMRAYFEQSNGEPRNLHQVLIFQWGHIDRHLRQIEKVKQHPNYPK